ncbi:DUF6161 domain-containing protein [Ferrovibrio sp.]|uniref:DUF6161 domain-containing protein n=1 Tax=Ferrovibrio sp. TaxID=1917215 RepID=UPI00311DE632
MDFFINLQVGPTTKITLHTIEDTESFLDSELEKWKSLEGLETRHASIRNQVLKFQLEQIQSAKNMAKEAPKIEKYALRLQNWFLQYNPSRNGARALCSLIPEDATVLVIAKDDPDAAALGFAARQRAINLLGALSDADKADAMLALNRYSMASISGHPDQLGLVEARKQILSLTREWEQEAEQTLKKIGATLSDSQGKLSALNARQEEQETHFEEILKKQDDTVKEVVRRYMEEMSLRAPVKYWTDLASNSQKHAYVWFFFFGLLALFLFGAVAIFGPDLLSLLKDEKGSLSLAAAPLLVAAMLPLFWVLKHFARMFTENLSDARDAKQRASLTSTFLALSTKEAVTFSDAERAIIVQALFRPSPAQTADDGVPLPLAELLKK